LLSPEQIDEIHWRLKQRVKIGVGEYGRVMREREVAYGRFQGKV
jgi:hypothetical protein